MTAAPPPGKQAFGPVLPKTDAEIATWCAAILRSLHSGSPGAVAIAATLDVMATQFTELYAQREQMRRLVVAARAETKAIALEACNLPAWLQTEFDNVP